MRLIDADALIKEACAEGAYGYVDAKQIADAPLLMPCQFGMGGGKLIQIGLIH